MFNLAGEDVLHVGAHILIVVGDDHVLAADDVAGTQQHRVAQLVGGVEGLVHAQNTPALGTLDVEALQQLVKALPVLGHIDGLGAGAQDGDAVAV